MTVHTGPDRTGTKAAYTDALRRKRLYSGLLLLLFVLLMMSGFRVAEQRNAGDFLPGLAQLGDFPWEVISEAWTNRAAIPGFFAAHVMSLIETINIAAVSTMVGALAAMVLAPLSIRGLALWPRLIPVFRRFLDIMRAFPEIIIALVLIYILGGGPVLAMIAIAIHTAGALGKMFSEVAENADTKPLEGLTSVGANWTQRIWLGLIPQVAPDWFSYGLQRFEINIRASAILGFVGSGGIGYDQKIAMQWGQGRYDRVVAIFLLLFFTIVDGLIWTIILARAFGPGPMTGALAILITDTGSFGKKFSETLENIDEKQVEGVRSTGANALQRARFAVIPQITPVLLGQVLYNFDSNTLSATIIGAIVGGGIGLLLTQAISTQKDWEEVACYMVLIILMVIGIDTLSGWLRRKLIRG